MSRYTTKSYPQQGTTYILDRGRSVLVAVGVDHAGTAQFFADAANEKLETTRTATEAVDELAGAPEQAAAEA